ncbi:OmpA family protein [Aeoliella sp. ICT_H6.2]|uniref:OmpA family protein n=1 Tax=Aeoliella straminimaris TaxID=2954799 RepID=A0A9X2FFN6_9BACT|nr:OmpA family protein [Aeoliella straminimaris]MCO6047348.1 OmpA family protein [Aeoliella straminimaris]
MAIEEDPPPGVAEWVVTFGDMMSLLLTFFIMLVSMSELKEEERFQAMLESMRRQFGHETSMSAVLPGHSHANSSLAYIAPSQSRSLRKNLKDGGNDVPAVTGEHNRVQTVRHGRNSTTGGVVYFDELSADLTDDAKQKLRTIAQQVAGKPQKLEIRGHASRRPVDTAQGVRDHWDLAYNRCYNVMKYLIEQGIEPERIRLGSAGANEPVDLGLDPEDRKRNARVEVLIWDERVVSPDLE